MDNLNNSREYAGLDNCTIMKSIQLSELGNPKCIVDKENKARGNIKEGTPKGKDFGILTKLKNLQLHIPLGQLLTLVLDYKMKLLKELTKENEGIHVSQTLTCAVEINNDWGKTIPKLIVEIKEVNTS